MLFKYARMRNNPFAPGLFKNPRQTTRMVKMAVTQKNGFNTLKIKITFFNIVRQSNSLSRIKKIGFIAMFDKYRKTMFT